MNILNYQLTEEDIVWCKRWAERYSNIIVCLTNEYDFTEESLGKLIIFEAVNRQRIDLLHRMMARYAKLKRRREWHELLDFIEETKNAKTRDRERRRKISMSRSREPIEGDSI